MARKSIRVRESAGSPLICGAQSGEGFHLWEPLDRSSSQVVSVRRLELQYGNILPDSLWIS